MVREAPLERSGAGLAPKRAGWFVLNVRDARWRDGGKFGAYTRFEGDVRFPQLGINIGVLEPGQPSCLYHAEEDQEDFLVLSGEALLLVEGEERPLEQWDFFHSAPWTEHVIIGAGDGPCVILAVGPRPGGDIVYPVSEVALQHGASVEQETRSGEEAYGGLPPDPDTDFQDRWLPAK